MKRAYSGHVGLFGMWGLQTEPRRVSNHGRPGHLIPEGSKQLADVTRSATAGEVCCLSGAAGWWQAIPSDAPRVPIAINCSKI
jgi:hypothetical protein